MIPILVIYIVIKILISFADFPEIYNSFIALIVRVIAIALVLVFFSLCIGLGGYILSFLFDYGSFNLWKFLFYPLFKP
jgi:hypothetical protein